MQIPNWIKIVWWLAILAVLTAYLFGRYPALMGGTASAADVVVFLVWISLLLAPVFSEVTLLGISLKQDIQELKQTVSTEVAAIRSEVRNAVDVKATFSPQFHMPAPAPDAQLPDLEARIKAALAEALSEHPLRPSRVPATIEAPDDVTTLFAARYSIERELRRISAGLERQHEPITIRRRPLPVFQLVRQLAASGTIDERIAAAVSEVYSVCSPAIHGEPVSDAQVAFVKEVAPEIIATLRAV